MKLIRKVQQGLNTQDIINIKTLPGYSNNAVEYWKFSKGNSEPAKFFQSYINSQGFKRILNNQTRWWKARHPFRKYISNPDTQRVEDFYNVAKLMKPNYYIAKKLPIELSSTFTRSDQPKRLFKNSKDIVIGGDKNYTNEDLPFNFVVGHEYLHGINPTDVLFTWENSAQGEALQQNTKTHPGHDSKEEEKLADIQGLKYLLYKEGIYDVRKNKDITIPQVQKLRKKYPKLRPFTQMNNKQVQFMINNVAQSDNTQPSDPNYTT